MNKNQFNNFKLKTGTFVFAFEPFPEIERTSLINSFETELNLIFDKGAILTKVPNNAPAEVPRFILSSKKKRSLEVSLIHVAFKFELDELMFDPAIKFFQEKTTKIFNCIKSKNFKFQAFISSIAFTYSLKDMNYNIENELYDNSIKIQKPAGFKSAAITLNREHDGLNFQNSYEIFEVRTGTFNIDATQFKDKANQFLQIKKDDLILVDKGLQNRFTVSPLKNLDDQTRTNAEDLFSKILNLSVKDRFDEFIFNY